MIARTSYQASMDIQNSLLYACTNTPCELAEETKASIERWEVRKGKEEKVRSKEEALKAASPGGAMSTYHF